MKERGSKMTARNPIERVRERMREQDAWMRELKVNSIYAQAMFVALNANDDLNKRDINNKQQYLSIDDAMETVLDWLQDY